ncbi:MAG: ATP-binding cassette domain-containing protein [Ignavibacteriales bacterium]|nr:ATP-binding cassette domain-containing protein [Ignavibacteriales bacterium]
MSEELIRLINVSKDYTDKVGYRIHLLEDISLSVKQNEIVTVLAPKGSGKSSLLKIICGLEKRTSGELIPVEK